MNDFQGEENYSSLSTFFAGNLFIRQSIFVVVGKRKIYIILEAVNLEDSHHELLSRKIHLSSELS